MLRAMQRRRELRSEVAKLLTSLGAEPQAIAANFAHLGMHGIPHDPHNCVVARYLSAIVGTDPAVSRVVVSRTDLALRRSRRFALPIRVPLPPAMRNFITAFDAYEIPDLVARVPVLPPTRHHLGPAS